MMGKEGWQLGRGSPLPKHPEAPGPLGHLPLRDGSALQGRALPGAGLKPRLLA